MRRANGSAVWFVLLASSAFAQSNLPDPSPSVRAIFPMGGQRGEAVEDTAQHQSNEVQPGIDVPPPSARRHRGSEHRPELRDCGSPDSRKGDGFFVHAGRRTQGKLPGQRAGSRTARVATAPGCGQDRPPGAVDYVSPPCESRGMTYHQPYAGLREIPGAVWNDELYFWNWRNQYS